MESRRILVVDDDPDILTLVKLSLEVLHGWHVLTASNPVEGVRLAAAGAPEVVLLDMSFPGTDGLDVLKQLQSAEATSRLPVVLVSGRVTSATRKDLLASGATGVIEKPYDPDHLADELKAMLGW